jgi:hypothetical protein
VRPSIPQTAPEVRCKQPATPPISAAPAADAWVAWFPGSTTAQAAAVLSEQAVTWIAEVLGTIKKERQLRGIEHDCLDGLEKKGLIRQ